MAPGVVRAESLLYLYLWCLVLGRPYKFIKCKL